MPRKNSRTLKDKAYWARIATKTANVSVTIDDRAHPRIAKPTRGQVILAKGTTVPVRAVKGVRPGLASRPLKRPLQEKAPYNLGDLPEVQFMGHLTAENVGMRSRLIPDKRLAQEPRRDEAQVVAGNVIGELGLVVAGKGSSLGMFCPLIYDSAAAARMSRGERGVWQPTRPEPVREWIDGAMRTHEIPVSRERSPTRAALEALRLVMGTRHA